MASHGKLLVLSLLVLTLVSTPAEARALPDDNLKQLKAALVTDVMEAACASLGVFCEAKKELRCPKEGEKCAYIDHDPDHYTACCEGFVCIGPRAFFPGECVPINEMQI